MRRISITNWLTDKLISGENGIIFDELHSDSFKIVQDFLSANDRPFKTLAIYYQAFPGESAAEFLSVLREELTAKFGDLNLDSSKSLPEITNIVGLRMVIIDRSHLHPSETLDTLLNQFAVCNVCLILIGTSSQMKIARILDRPAIARWDRLRLDNPHEGLCEHN